MGRTTVVLAIVAAAMLAFIVLFERDTISSRELEERKGRVLTRFARSRIDKLEIARGKTVVVMSRQPDAELEYELGEWKIEQPFSARADESVVDSLLGELEWLEPERTLSGVGPDDRKRFGFDKPRLRVKYAMGKDRASLVVGGDDPKGQGVYATADDPSVAFVVGKELVEALEHEPGYFHTKELHEGIRSYRVRTLELRDGEGRRVVEKRDELFWLTEPVPALASASAVQETLDALDDMRAKRFVAQELQNPGKYGLDAPWLEAIVQEESASESAQEGDKGAQGGDKEAQHGDRGTKVGKKQPAKGERTRLRFRLGSRCREKDAKDEFYAVVGEAGPVMCVAEEALSKVRKTAEALRDKRLLPIEDGKIKVLHLAAGARRLELRHKEYVWHYRAYMDKREVASGEADQDAVEQWFKALRATEARAFAAADSAGLRAARVQTPRTNLTVEMRGSDHKFAIKVGSLQGDTVSVQRDQEPWVASFPASCLDLLAPTSVRFRKLQLLKEPVKELVRIDVQRNGTLETLVKGEGDKWSLQKPCNAPADPVTAPELARLLAELEADRYVADLAEPRYGLDRPYLTISAHYEASAATAGDTAPGEEHEKWEVSDASTAKGAEKRTRVLKLGKALEGGRYAQLDEDPAVFAVSPALLRQVEQPLVSRELVTAPKKDIEEVVLHRGDRTVSIRRKGEGFEVVGGDDGRAEEAGELAAHVSRLRASSAVGYGKPTAEQGLQAPSDRVVVRHRSDEEGQQTYELLFGSDAKLPGQDEVQVYARRADLPVTFTIAASAKKQLFELLR